MALQELTKAFQESEIEIAVEKQQQKIIKLIDRQRKIPGLTLWEYNYTTKILIPAKYKKQDLKVNSLVPSSSAAIISHKVQVAEHCIYFQALNRNNAVKKLKKISLWPA